MSERNDEMERPGGDGGGIAVRGASAAQVALSAVAPAATSALDALELPVEVRLGSVVWRLGRVLELRVGDAAPVGADGGDAVTLCVQGQPYALGALLVVDGRFAFRVRELCAGAERGRRP